jgi:hypothetical protein
LVIKIKKTGFDDMDMSDYRIVGGPATMCDYYMETRGRIIPKKSGLPKCQHDEEADEKPCSNFFCGMCRYMPIKKKD